MPYRLDSLEIFDAVAEQILTPNDIDRQQMEP